MQYLVVYAVFLRLNRCNSFSCYHEEGRKGREEESYTPSGKKEIYIVMNE